MWHPSKVQTASTKRRVMQSARSLRLAVLSLLLFLPLAALLRGPHSTTASLHCRHSLPGLSRRWQA